jgi:hypothetical protein
LKLHIERVKIQLRRKGTAIPRRGFKNLRVKDNRGQESDVVSKPSAARRKPKASTKPST